MANIAEQVRAKAKQQKASAALKRLATALQPLEEFEDLEVSLTEGKFPGITINGLSGELRRIALGEEEGTFSFTNTKKTETGRRNIKRAKVIQIVTDAAARVVANQ
jgi:hypothetical protein